MLKKKKKALTLKKKHKKHSSPSKKSEPQKKTQKNTTVLLKALTTIPVKVIHEGNVKCFYFYPKVGGGLSTKYICFQKVFLLCGSVRSTGYN